MEAEAPLAAAAARVPNSPGSDEGCDSVATLKSKLAAKERDVVETTKKVDDLTARLLGLDETLEALRKEKESELANLAGEKDKRIAELVEALAAKGRDDGDDAGPSTSTDAPHPGTLGVKASTPRRVKAVSSKALHGRNSHFATSTPINKGKAKAHVACNSSLPELNGDAHGADDDEERERSARKKSKAARPSRGRSGRKPSSNAVLGRCRGKKKEKRDFDAGEAYTEPDWSKHDFFTKNKITSKASLTKFIVAYKLRAHRGHLEDKHHKWYPRAAKYEADDFLRLLDNKKGDYTSHNIESLLEYLGEDEGKDFGKGMPFYNRAHRIASLLFANCGVTSDRKTFDVHTRPNDGNVGDDYIFERARKFCTALNTVAMLHDIWTGEVPDVAPWKEGDPLTKPKGKKRARRPSAAAAAAPSSKRRALPSHTDDDDSDAEDVDAEDPEEDSDDEDEGEDDSDSSSGEFAVPSEEELAKYAEECLAEGAKKDDYDAAIDHWHAKYPVGMRNAPEPPWRKDESWGHGLRDRKAAPAPAPAPSPADDWDSDGD